MTEYENTRGVEPLTRGGVEEVRRHPASRAELALVATIDALRIDLAAERAALAAAREECERLKTPRLIQAAPDVVFEEYEDPHTGELLYRQKTSAELAALRARADDAGRVERVARMIWYANPPEIHGWGDASEPARNKYLELARAVLAAADGKGRVRS